MAHAALSQWLEARLRIGCRNPRMIRPCNIVFTDDDLLAIFRTSSNVLLSFVYQPDDKPHKPQHLTLNLPQLGLSSVKPTLVSGLGAC